MCDRKNVYVLVVRAEDHIEGEPPEDRPPEAWVKCFKPSRGIGDEVNQAIQLIQESTCSTNASFGVPGGGSISVL